MRESDEPHTQLLAEAPSTFPMLCLPAIYPAHHATSVRGSQPIRAAVSVFNSNLSLFWSEGRFPAKLTVALFRAPQFSLLFLFCLFLSSRRVFQSLVRGQRSQQTGSSSIHLWLTPTEWTLNSSLLPLFDTCVTFDRLRYFLLCFLM